MPVVVVAVVAVVVGCCCVVYCSGTVMASVRNRSVRLRRPSAAAARSTNFQLQMALALSLSASDHERRSSELKSSSQSVEAASASRSASDRPSTRVTGTGRQQRSKKRKSTKATHAQQAKAKTTRQPCRKRAEEGVSPCSVVASTAGKVRTRQSAARKSVANANAAATREVCEQEAAVETGALLSAEQTERVWKQQMRGAGIAAGHGVDLQVATALATQEASGELSEYEKQRLARMADNERVLASIGVKDDVAELTALVSSPPSRPRSSDSGRPRRTPPVRAVRVAIGVGRLQMSLLEMY